MELCITWNGSGEESKYSIAFLASGMSLKYFGRKARDFVEDVALVEKDLARVMRRIWGRRRVWLIVIFIFSVVVVLMLSVKVWVCNYL